MSVPKPAARPPPITYQRPSTTAEARPWRFVGRSGARRPGHRRKVERLVLGIRRHRVEVLAPGDMDHVPDQPGGAAAAGRRQVRQRSPGIRRRVVLLDGADLLRLPSTDRDQLAVRGDRGEVLALRRHRRKIRLPHAGRDVVGPEGAASGPRRRRRRHRSSRRSRPRRAANGRPASARAPSSGRPSGRSATGRIGPPA